MVRTSKAGGGGGGGGRGGATVSSDKSGGVGGGAEELVNSLSTDDVSLAAGGGVRVSSSSMVMMSHSGGAGQVMGMAGGATAFPKLELRDKKTKSLSACHPGLSDSTQNLDLINQDQLNRAYSTDQTKNLS